MHELPLTGGMMKYGWGINGRRFDMENQLEHSFDMRVGERVLVTFIKDADMWHPRHIHGHAFQIGEAGAHRHTMVVRPGETVIVYFEAGMMGVSSFIK
ncbi:multicopper oxidase [Arthrobacter sp. PAMC 25486]|uniref:multicopper oxidase domain-containing protein n=1 Tax=Arthrobacter sp. PAMC 25486 TaxID=1494608 RepID=UPI000535A9D9|nr:multicopper oxidase domain-containing protein [Arthrobacter sp. PAMC 25486]AIY00427.1 multicopper oxidase [Arthrobacter sp. PAMC 25486]